MGELNAIKGDIGEVKTVVDVLKTDVAVIKTEVGIMKDSITVAVEKISDSMVALATVSEKLNSNLEEHKHINSKLEIIELEQDAQRVTVHEVKVAHENCYTRRQTEEDRRKNSPLQKAKDKIVEWTFVFLVALVVFIIYSHTATFFKWMSSNGIGIGVSVSP